MLVKLPAQITLLRIINVWQLLAIHEALDERRFAINFEPLLDGTVQRVVPGRKQTLFIDDGAAIILSLIEIPGEGYLAGRIMQLPPITGVHAVLEQQVAGDVVTGHAARRDVLHYQVATRVADPKQLAFRIELCEC